MSNAATSGAKSGLENACKKAVDRIKKAAPGEKNEKKLAELLNKQVCKGVDQKLLKLLAEQIAKQAKKASAKADPNAPKKIDAKPSLKKPGSGVPSLKLPLGSFDLLGDKAKDSKLELLIWADPADFEKKDKGLMLNFTVRF
ncbi:MAG: hypothetical protein AAGJ46_11435 [Planctomycetota bacterium]